MITVRSLKHSLIAFVFVACLFILSQVVVYAQTIPQIKLGGWAWSSNIGWISLSCENDNNCANSSYGVVINADRSVTGFAWSSNIGWIKFGGLPTPLPAAVGGTVRRDAYASGTMPQLELIGWARACAATLNGDCRSSTISPKSGGWDGWVSLSGDTHTVGINTNTGMKNSAWAWGSDVIGWIDMHSKVTVVVPTNPVTLAGTGCEIADDASSCSGKVTWSFPDIYTNPSIYNVTKGTTFSNNIASKNDSPITLTYGTNGITTLHAKSNGSELSPVVSISLEAKCKQGSAIVSGVCTPTGASVIPDITVVINPPVVRMNGTTSVTVTISPTPYTGICTITGPGINTPMAANEASKKVETAPLKNRSTIKVSCTDSSFAEPVIKTGFVDVIPLAQEV